MTDLTKTIYRDDKAARKHLEAIRWASGPFCPFCGTLEGITRLKGEDGRLHCKECRKKFSVTVGTVFERSHIPLHKWLLASHLMAASKKGVSAHQLHRMLGITYKSAWFMAHRLREAMREVNPGPLGGEGKTVEVDETIIGGKERNKRKSKRNPKNIGAVGKEVAFSLVERGGKVRSHHVPNVSAKTLRPILVAQVDRKSFLMTDDAGQYRHVGKEYAKHETVNHGIEEYVRGEAHTNTIEGYFSLLKRGITGTYHHVSQAHLKRYLGEFDFRYNTRTALNVDDDMRATKLLQGIEGKRLTYRRADETSNA
ncbi:MAG: IS1595 family transposase [Dongiaceae bacterium]